MSNIIIIHWGSVKSCRSCCDTKIFLYDLYNDSEIIIGYMIRRKTSIDKVISIQDEVHVDGNFQMNITYSQKTAPSFQIIDTILSPQGCLSKVYIFESKKTMIITSQSVIVQALLPFDPKDVKPEQFFTVLRMYRYTLEPSIADTARPIIRDQALQEHDMYIQFNYFDWIQEKRTRGGPLGPGHDQYATYFDYPNEQTAPFYEALSVTIHDLSSVNYLSLSYGNPTDPKLINSLPYGYTDVSPVITYSICDDHEIPSPFVAPNPTLGCYNGLRYCSRLEYPSHNDPLGIEGNVNVYRLDEQSSAFIEGDQYKVGECLYTYLFATLTPELPTQITDCSTFEITKNYGIIQYPIPSSLFRNRLCHASYPSNLDVQYWSVSSHLCNIPTPPPYTPFWTVNAEMMFDISVDGYGYVLWASYNEVLTYVKDPKSPYPPIIDLSNNRKAYLLVLPSLAFIFRYRQPNVGWSGNPVHAKCYKTSKTNQPITDQLVGPDGVNWCPQIYGSDEFTSLQDFINSIL